MVKEKRSRERKVEGGRERRRRVVEWGAGAGEGGDARGVGLLVVDISVPIASSWEGLVQVGGTVRECALHHFVLQLSLGVRIADQSHDGRSSASNRLSPHN